MREEDLKASRAQDKGDAMAFENQNLQPQLILGSVKVVDLATEAQRTDVIETEKHRPIKISSREKDKEEIAQKNLERRDANELRRQFEF